MIKNPNDPVIYEILRRLRDLETTAPGGSTAVSRGRTRFVGNESVLVEGSGKVSGWWIVTGTLRVIGTLQMLGNMVVEGLMTLAGEIIVAAGGKITVGGMVIDPADGGSVKFPGIGAVRADTNGVRIEAGNTFAVVRQGYAYIGLPGQSFSVDGLNGPRIQGLPTVSSMSTGLPIGTLYVDPSGYLYRVAF